MTDQSIHTSTHLQLLREHAEGGLGRISVALDEGLNREVAFKEILPQRAMHPASRDRFVREAEITGGLEHPGVVPVYGMGHYDDGRPFYAMRFIKGESLLSVIEAFHGADVPGRDPGQRSLALRKLLGRFLDICHAVGYAHSRGVLHRDLKPDNVMLGDYGETLVVDWGLAKAVGESEVMPPGDEPALISKTGSGSHETRMGSAIGTPAYMSPEQAAGQIDRLGPATDIYALGGTLYTLLTGKPPIPPTSQEEMLASAIVGNFPRPRDVKPGIPRALEAICLKAMATDRAARYESATALGDDIEHWLADERVTAHAESWFEQAARWTRRYRTLVRAASLSLLVITVVAVVAAVLIDGQRNVAIRERNKAETAKEKESEARKEAEKRRQEADAARLKEAQARREAEHVVEFMVEAFRSPDPRRDGRDIRAAELLDQAIGRLEGELAAQPLVRAAFLAATGVSYRGLGLPSDAVEVLEKAVQVRRELLGNVHPDTVETTTDLALAYQDSSRLDAAISLFQQVLGHYEKDLGEDHLDTLKATNNLGMAYEDAGRLEDALALLTKALPKARATLGENNALTLIMMNNLAAIYQTAGQYSQALVLLKETYSRSCDLLGEDDPDTLTALNNLAQAYGATGQMDEALRLLEGMLERTKTKLGEDHPNTLAVMNNLAGAYKAAGRLDKALTLHELVYPLTLEKLGEAHSDTPLAMNNLALTYQEVGRAHDAVPLFEKALELQQATLGEDHPRTFIIMSNLAGAYQEVGQLDKTLQLLEESLKRTRAKLGDDHPSALRTMNSLAVAYQKAKRLDEATSLLEETLKRMQSKLGDKHPDALVVMVNLAMVHQTTGQLERAIPLYEEAIVKARDVFGKGHPHTQFFTKKLAGAYVADKRPAKAIELFEEAGMEAEAEALREKLQQQR